MPKLTRLLAVLPALSLAGCAVLGTSPDFSTGPSLTSPAEIAAPSSQSPAQTTASAAAMTDISAYIDPAAFKQMTEKSRAEAAGAQFNALQFGRVGAPRNWQGDQGVAGQVTVGPFVRVNLIDCRDFTHAVTISGVGFVWKGTACREADGSWAVVESRAG